MQKTNKRHINRGVGKVLVARNCTNLGNEAGETYHLFHVDMAYICTYTLHIAYEL